MTNQKTDKEQDGVDRPEKRPAKLIPLFYGDNGLHEFWQSADRVLLTLRNHGEKHWWTIHIDHGPVSRATSAKRAAAKLGAFLDSSRTWVKVKGKPVYELRERGKVKA